MRSPEGWQVANRFTTVTPSGVQPGLNTQPFERDNSSVCKRCQAGPTQRVGQLHLLPATGPELALGCWRSFQGWAVSEDGDGTEPSYCFGPRCCEAARQKRHLLRTFEQAQYAWVAATWSPSTSPKSGELGQDFIETIMKRKWGHEVTPSQGLWSAPLAW